MALRPRQKSEDANTENFDTPRRGRQFAGASGSPVSERTDVPERAPPAAAAAAAPAKKKGKQVAVCGCPDVCHRCPACYSLWHAL
jgi:hypothetical protein